MSFSEIVDARRVVYQGMTKNQASNNTIICVVGARPNFMKIAPIMAALRALDSASPIDTCLVHTGQHYDMDMNQRFFDQLRIPKPNVDLEVGSSSHAVQTALIMQRFEPVVDEVRPAAVLVVGDVNSTVACGLVAVKKGVPVIHVEAGLRSGDRTMPEEINRILTDQLSDLLFTTERRARENLLREGIAETRIHFVGNVMIDTLLGHLPMAVGPHSLFYQIPGARLFQDLTRYGLLTLHRPSNVDSVETLKRLLTTIREISETLPIVFPIHPRTQCRIRETGLGPCLDTPRILTVPPQGYLEMLGLMKHAAVVLTDSGGIQEETTALGVPCLTLRENTERPITVEQGTNTVVGTDPARIQAVFSDVMTTGGKAGRVPEFWDGHAADRIARSLSEWLG